MIRNFDETHGTRVELLRHFLPRFFDSELVSVKGDWSRVLAGAIAILGSSWLLLGYTLLIKYKKLADLHLDPGPEIRADLGSLTGMVICATVLLIAVFWQSNLSGVQLLDRYQGY